MTQDKVIHSKYGSETNRVLVPHEVAMDLTQAILCAKGCPEDIAAVVAQHLVESDYSGVESHGIWRIIQYSGYYDTGYMIANVRPELVRNSQDVWEVHGNGGIGIPALEIATEHATNEALEKGLAAIAIRDVGHTGRLGAFAEAAASRGCLAIIVGGGGRENWRLVAPHGGAKALMSTNPYSIGVPGGDRGPVVLDFATSAAAAGWVYGARVARATLPLGILMDKDGNPSQDPESYFQGGAILPAGGAKGYAMAVVAEMIAEAMLGPVRTECHWLVIALDCARYRQRHAMQAAAEEILAELRDCPPAAGFDRVEVPGEREREQRALNAGKGVYLPRATWQEIDNLARDLGIDTPKLST